MSQVNLEDTYRHKGMRRKLVNELKRKGIKDESVLEAFMMLPRHFFLDRAFEELAYEDQALPIAAGQTISQPYTVAYQTSLLDVKPGLRVLEIGTGSGYQACILSLIGAKVYSIERQELLYKTTAKLLEKMGFSAIRLYHRDGYLGLPEIAPFDRILVTAGAPDVPPALIEQLNIGGKLVIPVGDEVQQMIRITKNKDGSYSKEIFEDFKFVPLLKGTVHK
jgi:protein-L-isoaspartate(D-aspartate) O-methyltransferase